ncbi:MAG TPA: glycosyltransferase family 4 protein [Longimicrobium sp.]|jgi:glycosyltransferase involved in cell wall biosynthesis
MSRPLRLLTVGHSYVVGANRRLAHEMAAAGAGEWEVTAVAPQRFPGDLRKVALEPVEGERCRVEAVPVHLARRVHVMRYGRRLREIVREGWDVVHCWEEPYVLAASQVAALAPESAALVFATFQNLPKRYPWPFSRLERRAMRRADGWIAFGKTVEETLRDRPGYRDLPHRVIPPGVDAERFRPDPEARRRVREALKWTEDGPPVVGFLGRFVPEKGLATLMDALEECRRPWRALLVGGGPLEKDAATFRAARMDRVRIVTGVPHDQVPAYLGAMDVLCAPSETTPRWREQFGRMLTEAMACGVPVIGSDSGEIPHVIGDAGVVVPERDPEALSRAIDALAADPERRAELSRRGLERARAGFALPAVARRHLDFFAEVLQGKREKR